MIEILKNIIKDFHTTKLKKEVFTRDLKVPINSGKVITITGPRRSGKSMFFHSLIKELEAKSSKKKIIYINFEDDRIIKEKFKFQDILDAYSQLYPEMELSELYFFFDEIQEMEDWGKFIRRLTETVTSNIFITGSSAKMLSADIVSTLRGRSLVYHLYPLSFKEYCGFKKIDTEDLYSTKNKNLLYSTYQEFMKKGGYPETVFFNEDLRIKTLQSYTDVMLYRDIIERFDIKNIFVLKDMLRRFVANTAQTFSTNKYFNDLKSRDYKISKDKLYEYAEYFRDTFFVHQLPKYSASIAKQAQALKKTYMIDTGIISAYNFSLAQNYGFVLENLVCNELLKRDKNIFYQKNGYECDFVTTEKDEVDELIQVCYDLNDNNKKREYKGILSAAKHFNKTKGILITDMIEDEIIVDGIKISIIPAWKWMSNS